MRRRRGDRDARRRDVAAQSRGDAERILALALRAAGVPGAHDHPIARVARASISGVLAEMRGDPETAVEQFAAARLHEVAPGLALSANRFLGHCLMLCGRADEAAELAERTLSDIGSRHSRWAVDFTRWAAGDPTRFFDEAALADYATPQAGASARDAFVAGTFRAVIQASLGLHGTFESRPLDQPRDAALVTNAAAAQAVLAHDEARAAAAFAAFLDRHPDDALGERNLRRFLALGYVLDERLRARWEVAPVGPSHERARDVARAFVALRDGKPPPERELSPPVVVTVLPLPWSIELACRLHGAGSPAGANLAAWLVDHLGGVARDELRVAARRRSAYSQHASVLLGRLPVEPADVLEIRVLGPLEVRQGDHDVVRPELRRARVRELVSMLVVEPVLARDRAIGLLWPELDADAGARNLRVTLSYVRHLLEPGRPAGEASFHLRADALQVQLVPSRKLLVDLWELRRLAADAAAARREGDVTLAVALLRQATGLWRGAPLTEFDRVGRLETSVEEVRLLQLSLLLELGELQLAAGDAAGALASAERALGIQPYLEQAHRLAIAANVQRRDPARVSTAVDRARRALDELGVAPEPAMLMLMRHAAAQVPTPVG